MKLLNIAIPTYNRPAELRHLADDFLLPVLSRFGDCVAVHVFDNSDPAPAQLNSRLASQGISYTRNQGNLGFSGNVLLCAAVKGAEYLWIISDNDSPKLHNFERLLEAVERCALLGTEAVMLPFTLAFNGAEIGLRNTANLLEVPTEGRFSELVNQVRRLPFVLFSSVVLRTNHPRCEAAVAYTRDNFPGNDYIQIPLFWQIIGKDGRYAFFDEPALQYDEDFESRFQFTLLVGALDRIIAWAPVTEAQRRRLSIDHYRDWCFWLLRHRAGHRRVRYPRLLYWLLLKELPKHFSAKNIAALILPLLPNSVAERILGELHRTTSAPNRWMLDQEKQRGR